MLTLSELLKSEEKQELVLANIINVLRLRGEWGTHGLFRTIGLQTGISPAYVGRALTGKNRITNTLVLKLSGYFRVPAQWLCGEMEGRSYEEVKAAFERGFGLEPAAVESEGEKAVDKNGVNLRQELERQASLFVGVADQVLGEGGLERAAGGKAALEEFVEEAKNVFNDSDSTAEEQVARLQALLKPILLGIEKAIKDVPPK